MEIINDFNTSVCKALDEIDAFWREGEGLIVCGTHAPDNIEEAIEKIKEYRIARKPVLGICFGLHLMAIEYARNVLGQPNATSEEFGEGDLVVRKLPELRVGLIDGESYWHNYAVVPELLEKMAKDVFSPRYVGVQYHPEYQSSRGRPHPILENFLNECRPAKHKEEKQSEDIYCRWSPTLGELEDTSDNVWGIKEVDSRYNTIAKLPKLHDSMVFFGVYGLPDFWKIWRHKGKKWILWAGQDIVHLQNGYHLEDGGNIRVDSTPLAQWMNKYCENWCENEVEKEALSEMGIEAHIGQSFLGQVKDYQIEYKQADRPCVYLSANPGREVEYGWGIVEKIADQCDVDFHLYGSPKWTTSHSNVFVRGRVPKEQMNEEIKGMQCGLRLNDFDGFSEVTAKSILWGQYPITPESFKYPQITGYRDLKNLIWNLNNLKRMSQPNPARDYYIKNLNLFPWNQK